MNWPDGTPKSTNNAFDWRNRSSDLAPRKATPIPARSRNLNATDNIFTVYTKAVASIGNFPPVAISRGKRDSSTTPTKT